MSDCPNSKDGNGHCVHWWECEPCCWCGNDSGGEDECDCPRHTNQRSIKMSDRDQTHANTAEAVASGWTVTGDPDIWELLCKASNKSLGIMKSTKRMKVMGGNIYQVTTETPQGVAEALTFVPAE